MPTTKVSWVSQLQRGPVVDVRTYGAKGDGATNDTAAVLAAIAAVPVAGGTIYFPPGTFILDPDVIVTNGLTNVLGSGIGLTILTASGTGTTLWTVTGSLAASRSLTLREFQIGLTSFPAMNGLDMSVLYGGEVSRVWVQGGLSGIRCLTNTTRVQFRDLFLIDQNDCGMYVDGDTSAELRYDNLTIGRGTAGTTPYGIRIHRTTTADVGAHYLKGVQVLGYSAGGALVTNGIAVTSSTSSDTGTPLLLDQVVLEQIDGPCLLLQKSSIVFMTNSWLATVGTNSPTIQMDGSDNTYIANSTVTNSGAGAVVDFVVGTPTVATAIFRISGCRLASNTGKIFKLDAGNPPAVVQYQDNQGILDTNLTNDLALLQAAGSQVTTKACAVFVGSAAGTSGNGSPQGSVVGNPGDFYFNTAGGAGTTLWVKETGTGTNTGWVGK